MLNVKIPFILKLYEMKCIRYSQTALRCLYDSLLERIRFVTVLEFSFHYQCVHIKKAVKSAKLPSCYHNKIAGQCMKI